ncbi:MAG: carboxypeptidase regulatory-like domain-containing protein, partial [Bacteroidetes bacterium]|nr:carboxypeptidase regulatory-like domain-containing protein [Fibrella sp.]
MKRFYGLLIGALLISPALVAQIVTLTGIVRDSATRQPLARASVVIDFQKGRMGTSTDAQGHYSLDVPVGDRLLVIRHVG